MGQAELGSEAGVCDRSPQQDRAKRCAPCRETKDHRAGKQATRKNKVILSVPTPALLLVNSGVFPHAQLRAVILFMDK